MKIRIAAAAAAASTRQHNNHIYGWQDIKIENTRTEKGEEKAHHEKLMKKSFSGIQFRCSDVGEREFMKSSILCLLPFYIHYDAIPPYILQDERQQYSRNTRRYLL